MADSSRSYSPTRLARALGEDLLEREDELAEVQDALAAAASGEGTIAVIEGPAGIGKSSVLLRGVAAAGDAGFETASARGSELEREFAFGLVRQLFEPLLASSTPKRRSHLFDGAAGLARPLFEALDASKLNPSGEASHAVLHGLYWLTANVAGDMPLALVVDDAHWGDAPSLRFLAYLANRIDDAPVFLLVGTRPVEPGPAADLLDELATSPAARVIRPAPLSPDGVDRLIRSNLDVDPDRSFVTACFDATKGNPLFFRELLATVKAERIAPTAAEAGRILEVAPESIARSVSRRMRRLAPEASNLARAIAVLGDGAELPVAAQLAGLDSVDAAAAAVALSWAEILAPEGLEFVHPVVRAAVYSELSAAQRANEHRKAAKVLADQGADEDTIALHLLGGEPSGSSGVVDILRRAARRAHSRGAPDVAVTYLQRALSEPPPAAERVEITVELGLAELAALNFVTGLARMREAVERTEAPDARARVALRLAQSLFAIGALPDAAQVLEETLAESEGADPDLTERLEAELISLGVAVPALSARVVDRLDRLHNRRAEVRDPILLAALAADTATTRGPPKEALELAERSLSASSLSVVDNPAVVGLAVISLIALDHLDQAREILAQALSEARRRGSFFALGFAWSLRALVFVRLGALAAAEADARSGLDPLSAEARMAAPWLVPPLTDVQLERGELEVASRSLDEYGLGGELPDLLQMNQLLETRGRLRIAQNRLDEGIADLRECARRLAAWGHGVRNPGLIPWGPTLASALAASGEQDEAQTLAREQVELAREFEVPRELGMALRVAGLVEGGDDGIELLREAVAVLEPTAFELEHARALTDFGAAIRRGGHRSDAREPLRAGLDLARRCGATELAERAHRELVATGARPRRLTLSGVESLTASERRVADLASEGLTNREVAQALFVTEKTVEGHLAGCYRKLDISSRSELPHVLGGTLELARS